MIYAGSRYQNASVIQVPDSQRNIYVLAALNPPVPSSFITGQTFIYHTVVEGERYDTIAATYYSGNSNVWWTIADANPEILYPDELQAGTIIRVPV
jgi:hypothetical protein